MCPATLTPLLMIAAALFLGVSFVGRLCFEKQRTTGLRGVADQMGLEFQPKGDPSLQYSMSRFHLLKQGRSGKLKNLMVGSTNEVQTAIFEYEYITGRGNSRRRHTQTVIGFVSPTLAMPDFELRPSHFFHKIAKVVGYQDIDFEMHPRFSKRYVLRGPNEKRIRNFFTPERLDFLAEHRGICVEASRDQMIFYRAGKRIRPNDLQGLMEEGFGVFAFMQEETIA